MKVMNSALRIPSSALEGWLPDLDLNQDKQIQSLLCYRYTIGQAEAVRRLKSFIDQSSHTNTGVDKLRSVDARPGQSQTCFSPRLRPRPQERTPRTFIAPCTPEPAGVRSARRPGAQRVRMQSATWGRFRHEQAVGAAATGDRSRSKGRFIGREWGTSAMVVIQMHPKKH